MQRILAAAIACAALATGPLTGGACAASEAPAGTWLTEEGGSRIRLSPCGKAMCATIVWTKAGGTDANNPDPALRARSMVGVDLSRDMKPDGNGGWAGSIYNPQDGKTYQGTMQMKGERSLEVAGCVLGGLICGSETWTRQSDSTASVAPSRRP